MNKNKKEAEIKEDLQFIHNMESIQLGAYTKITSKLKRELENIDIAKYKDAAVIRARDEHFLKG